MSDREDYENHIQWCDKNVKLLHHLFSYVLYKAQCKQNERQPWHHSSCLILAITTTCLSRTTSRYWQSGLTCPYNKIGTAFCLSINTAIWTISSTSNQPPNQITTEVQNKAISEDDLWYIEQQIPDTVWSATQNINIYRANVITI